MEIVSFRAEVEPQASTPQAERILSGEPRLSAWNHYSDPSGQFHAGVWTATRGSWRINYSECEFCHLLQGRVVLTNLAGQRWSAQPPSQRLPAAGGIGSFYCAETFSAVLSTCVTPLVWRAT